MESHFFTSPKGSEWRAPPLWGLRASAPYLHDGRAGTWREAVAAHGGEAEAPAKRFAQLTEVDRHQMALFLDSLGPPPESRTSPPRPEGAPSAAREPGRRAAVRLAVARNLEQSGRLRAALDGYREVVREAPDTAEGRAAAARLRALGAGDGPRPAGPAAAPPSGGHERAPSILFTPPSRPNPGRAADLPDRADW